MRDNFDDIDKLLMITQNFPYQIFILAMSNVVLITLSSIFYSSIFSMQIYQYFALYGNLYCYKCSSLGVARVTPTNTDVLISLHIDSRLYAFIVMMYYQCPNTNS